MVLITHTSGSRRGRVFCLFFQTISQKPMQLGSANLTHKYSTMSPQNPFNLGSNGQGHDVCVKLQTERNINADCVGKPHWVSQRWFLHSRECQLLLVIDCTNQHEHYHFKINLPKDFSHTQKMLYLCFCHNILDGLSNTLQFHHWDRVENINTYLRTQ